MANDFAMILQVAVALSTCGLLMAFILPSHRLPEPWNYVSDSIGFTYTAAWSISFYPQLILNFKRRSVVGLSIDFQVLNLLGFACYAAYNVALFFVPVVQKQYKDAFQSQHIPRFNTIYGQLSAVVAIVAVAGFGLVALLQSQSHPVAHLTWIHFLLALSSVKLVVSLIKYIPQVFLNIRRQSTDGWSILNVLLDWLGGVLSVTQIVMQCVVLDDWQQIAGNPVKFGLGFVSLSFDIVFMLQHYVLYYSDGAGDVVPDAVNLLGDAEPDSSILQIQEKDDFEE